MPELAFTLALGDGKDMANGIPGRRISMKKKVKNWEHMWRDKGKGKFKNDPKFPFQGYQADGEALNRPKACHLAFILSSHVFYFSLYILPSWK